MVFILQQFELEGQPSPASIMADAHLQRSTLAWRTKLREAGEYRALGPTQRCGR